jgi:hypothetical protein
MHKVKRTTVQVPEPGWQNAFNVMKANYALTDDAIGVFAINLRFNLDDIQTIVSEAITGGGDDKKCDVLYVDKERQVAVIAQCYISRNSTYTPLLARRVSPTMGLTPSATDLHLIGGLEGSPEARPHGQQHPAWGRGSTPRTRRSRSAQRGEQ